MGPRRDRVSRWMSWGALSAGWYSVLTGSALLYLAYLLGTVSGDSAAPFVAAGFAVVGVCQLAIGLRVELRRKSASPDEPS
ncbi:hypothetical protein G6553_17300 [Nocardioides sp. IC4_145]|uniref:hypothetical protein n=1 Tax=Nocardioides sp. IC4_145 TaxID=2714037 RepID=UPI00140DA06B|nr:hypothetical protein [Nocardioides sp. IC4_145]NHC24927.1 hypothetical protein [Nocardioides sp. IC4_145]